MVEGSQRIVKITPDVYAFMLNYCRRGFTDVYADLRFVLSAGTHCPGIIIPLRHSPAASNRNFGFRSSWKILPPPLLAQVSNRRFSPVRALPLHAKFLHAVFFPSRMQNEMIFFFWSLLRCSIFRIFYTF